MKKEVQEALQKRDIEDLRKCLFDLKNDIKQGFDGVHERQDTTNGKVLRNASDIAEIKSHAQFDKITWYMITTAISLIILMGSYIFFK